MSKKPFDPEKLKTYPVKPGVYLMKDAKDRVLYVGKANNLRQRIKQYFVRGGDGREMIPYLIEQVSKIDTISVLSEKEALLLENTLIKKHKPKYNALLKDDKSYIALKLTKHPWPRIDLVRYRGKPKPDGIYFGPYTSAYAARSTLDLLHRLFPMRQCSDPEFARRTRPCILYDIKRCIAPCVGYCTEQEYQELVRRTMRFLRGQDKEIVKDLYREMEDFAEDLEFEKASEKLQLIRQIEKTIEKQYVEKPLGVDADVLGLFREGEEVVISQMYIRGGSLTGTRHYNFTRIAESDSELLQSFILQQFHHQTSLPHEILLPIPMDEAETLSEILSADSQRKVLVHTPQRGNKKALVKMAQINAEATYQKEKDERTILERTLLQMQEKLHLNSYPMRIECFDNSNLHGEEPVSVMVSFTDGVKDKRYYRKYKLRTVQGIDDYAAMQEVLIRRFKRAQEENNLPDLLIVDGGKGHLNVALKVLKALNIIQVDVIGVAKEESKHTRGITLEQVFLPNVKDPIRLPQNSQILFLLQRVRDEAHRFAITFHRARRSKKVVRSALDDIPGIGPAKRKALLKHFGSVKKIKEATVDEILQVKSISIKDADMILKKLGSNEAGA